MRLSPLQWMLSHLTGCMCFTCFFFLSAGQFGEGIVERQSSDSDAGGPDAAAADWILVASRDKEKSLFGSESNVRLALSQAAAPASLIDRRQHPCAVAYVFVCHSYWSGAMSLA